MTRTLNSPAFLPPSPEHPQSGPAFSAPWEARAFAMVVSLAQAGHFSWAEWVSCFAAELAEAEAVRAAGGQAQGYYACWLEAAEHLLAQKGLVSSESLLGQGGSAAPAGHQH